MKRRDFSLIASWVGKDCRVLDLGCGDGALLRDLADRKGCETQGLEVDDDSFLACVRNRVPVVQLDMDLDLSFFADSSFDVVVLSRTVQAVRHPEVVLQEMLRIAPRAIVSMPNFGYWKNRVKLLGGRAPISKDLPFQWYESPNIHFGSLRDLETLFSALGMTVSRQLSLAASGRVSITPKAWRNLCAGSALYELTRP